MVNLKELEDKYFCNGYDVPYKLRNGKILNIKPILVKDYPIYENAKIILDIQKNEINDIQIIQMSYLEFLAQVVMPQSENYVKYIEQIFDLCLGEKCVTLGTYKKKICFIITNERKEVLNIITSKDFDEIIEIILNQNDPKRDNRYISKDVREAYKEYCELKYKDINSPSFEKRKAFVMSKTGYRLDDLNNMTYRMFCLVYQSGIDTEIYIGEKIIQGSFKYDCKRNIIHPQFQKDADPITEMFSDAEAFEKKIQEVNG